MQKLPSNTSIPDVLFLFCTGNFHELLYTFPANVLKVSNENIRIIFIFIWWIKWLPRYVRKSETDEFLSILPCQSKILKMFRLLNHSYSHRKLQSYASSLNFQSSFTLLIHTLTASLMYMKIL